MEGGIEPVREFLYTENTVRAVKEPTEKGTDPVKAFPNRDNLFKDANPPKDDGSVPVKELLYMDSSVKAVRSPTEEGREPDRNIPFKLNPTTTSFSHFTPVHMLLGPHLVETSSQPVHPVSHVFLVVALIKSHRNLSSTLV